MDAEKNSAISPADEPLPSAAAADILIVIYYFGDHQESLEDYSTLTMYARDEDLDLTIHQIKQIVYFFIKNNSTQPAVRKSFSGEVVPLADDIISPIHAEAAPLIPENHSIPADIPARLIDGMIAVFSSEEHINQLVSNLERMHAVAGNEPGSLETLENWCLQDNIPLRRKLVGSEYNTQKKLSFILSLGSLMPVPRPRVRIVSTSKNCDIYQRLYTEYHMIVKQAGLEWTISHRYSGNSNHMLFIYFTVLIVVADVGCRFRHSSQSFISTGGHRRRIYSAIKDSRYSFERNRYLKVFFIMFYDITLRGDFSLFVGVNS